MIDMYFRQPTYTIPRIAQGFPINGAERIQISIFEVAEGPQSLGGLAAEHLLESAQARHQRHARRNHLGNIPVILGLSAIQRGLELDRYQVVKRGNVPSLV